MKIAVPREVHPNEQRVAATPDSVRRLVGLGFEVAVEAGAGAGAGFRDADYASAGADVVENRALLLGDADIVVKVRPPMPLGGDAHEVDLLREGTLLVSLLFPARVPELLERLAERGVDALALDRIPRISRAQKMDVLSSMANIAGYRAVIEAGQHYGGFFAGQITAAGKTPPAKVFVIGAGVAGLAAIGTARGLGAVVTAFDVRPSVADQIRSLGARFLELDLGESGEGAGGYAREMSKEFIEAEMAAFRELAPETDIVITTALVPGARAPRLWTKDMVERMKPGSVVVDLAAEQGGNCEVTVPDQVVVHRGVTIVGLTDLTSRLATHASTFFANNVVALLEDLGGAERWRLDLGDEIVRGALVVHGGAVLPPPEQRPAPEPETVETEPTPRNTQLAQAAEVLGEVAPEAPARRGDGAANLRTALATVVVVAAAVAIGRVAPSEFLQHFTVFVLACFVGWQVVWSVTPALHTPLMSVTNAISGIILVGGVLQAGSGNLDTAAVLGAVAILFAAINVAGGFLVTQRMLQMFRK